MKPPNCIKIVEAAMELRAASPENWERLVRAMGEYAAQILALTLSADPDKLLRAQGMAIQAGEIATIMRDAPKMLEAAQKQELTRAQNVRRQQHERAANSEWPPS